MTEELVALTGIESVSADPELPRVAKTKRNKPAVASPKKPKKPHESPGRERTVSAPLSDAELKNGLRDKLTNFLLHSAFIRRRPSSTIEYAAAWALAGYIKDGLIQARMVRMHSIPLPCREMRKIDRRYLRQKFLEVKRPRGNESDDHAWLKMIARENLRAVADDADYEVQYGPCAGDVVSLKAAIVIECGDTDPVRVQAVFDDPLLLFISLPYQPDISGARKFETYYFKLTEKGAASGLSSAWVVNETNRLRAWQQHLEEIGLFPAHPALIHTPQEPR